MQSWNLGKKKKKQYTWMKKGSYGEEIGAGIKKYICQCMDINIFKTKVLVDEKVIGNFIL